MLKLDANYMSSMFRKAHVSNIVYVKYILQITYQLFVTGWLARKEYEMHVKNSRKMIIWTEFKNYIFKIVRSIRV